MAQFDKTTLNLSKNIKISALAAVKLHPDEYKNIIKVAGTDLYKEQIMRYEGPGAAAIKSELGKAVQTEVKEGYVETILQEDYYFEMPVSRKQRAYAQKSINFVNLLGSYLTRSMKLRYEYVGIAPLNNGYSASYAGGDGKAYFAADHSFKVGGTYSNLLDNAALSKEKLETMYTVVAQAVVENDIPGAFIPRKINIGTSNIINLDEILKSVKDPETANNTYNVVQDWKLIKNLNHYKSDPNSYEVDTDVNTRTLYESMKPIADQYMDDPSDCLVERIKAALGSGFHDQASTFGSQGS